MYFFTNPITSDYYYFNLSNVCLSNYTPTDSRQCIQKLTHPPASYGGLRGGLFVPQVIGEQLCMGSTHPVVSPLWCPYWFTRPTHGGHPSPPATTSGAQRRVNARLISHQANTSEGTSFQAEFRGDPWDAEPRIAAQGCHHPAAMRTGLMTAPTVFQSKQPSQSIASGHE